MALSILEYADTHRGEVLAVWSAGLPLDAVSEEIFESRVLLDENFDPGTTLLAWDGGKLVGILVGVHAKRVPVGDADPKGVRSWITVLAVHPDARIDNVGRTLINEAESRFRSLGKTECYVSNYPPGYITPGIDMKAYAPLLKLFRDSGYEQFHEAISMDAPIVLFEFSADWKMQQQKLLEEGIEIRPYRRTDLAKYLDFLERMMPSDWLNVGRRNLRKLCEGGFHREQITLATKGDDIIGYCQFEGSHFGPFGVHGQFQGKGIGTILLGRTIERMKQEGFHDAWVMWTDDVAAKVYRKFGFRETRRFALLKKAL